jgi:hypothetical protein
VANTLTAILPKILARGLLTLRERAVAPRIVNLDYSTEAAMAGSTIDVPIPSAVAATDVTASNTPPSPGDTTMNTTQISLNKWKKSTPFHLTDKDMVELDENRHFVPMQIDEAIRGLANQVNDDVFAEYKNVYNCAEIPSSGSIFSDVSQITHARRLLNSENASPDNRRLVSNFVGEDAMLNLSGITAFNEVGGASGDAPRISGEFGNRFGFDLFADDSVPYHTTTATGTPLIDNGSGYSAGATTIHADGFTATPVVGDVIKIEHGGSTGDKFYTITAVSGYSSGDVDLTINNGGSVNGGLAAAVADNKALKMVPSHQVNLAFHRDAFALATRPLLAQTDEYDGLNSNMMSMTDPVTGLSLRLEVNRQYKQVAWEFDILYGVKLVRPELAVRCVDAAFAATLS